MQIISRKDQVAETLANNERNKATWNPQRLYAEHGLGQRREDIVRAAWRHAEPGRNDLAASKAEIQNAEAEKVLVVTILSAPIYRGRRRIEGSGS